MQRLHLALGGLHVAGVLVLAIEEAGAVGDAVADYNSMRHLGARVEVQTIRRTDAEGKPSAIMANRDRLFEGDETDCRKSAAVEQVVVEVGAVTFVSCNNLQHRSIHQ